MIELPFFAEAVKSSNGDLFRSITLVLVFLSILYFSGYVIVRVLRRNSFFAKNHQSTLKASDKIKVLDNKFLYGRKYISLVECGGRRLLILVNHDNAVKLSEWEVGQDEAN